ncbi:MAG: hypothetical protein NC340_00805 [Ruminococcus flavefaciens]|nr:hypothetical protein [Ruminococcus flavefaciens]MCM1228651.1 hypothetical protein [Ruminococcus flavefaciens]
MKRTISAILGFILCAGILTSCGLSEEAQKVKDMIDELPSTYSEEISDDLQKAEEAYNKLSADDKDSFNPKKLNALKDSRAQYVIDNTPTFGMTPDELVDKYKDEATDPDAFQYGYTATDNGDGTSDFTFDEKLGAIEWNGTLITDNQEITSITATFYVLDNDETMNNQILLIDLGFTLLTGKSKSEAGNLVTDKFGKALKNDDKTYEDDNYSYVVTFNASGSESYFTMTPKK